jgi:hypothetical protein
MLKKMMLLGLAIGALVAFAAPAAASAAVVVDTETSEAFTGTESFTGAIQFSSELGGVACGEATAVVGFSEGSSGEVEELGISLPTCKGSGAFTKCTLTVAELTSASSVTVTETDFDISPVTITDTFTGAECPVEHITLTFASITATPDSASSIGDLTLSGSGTADPLGLATTAFGTLTAAHPGTLAIE